MKTKKNEHKFHFTPSLGLFILPLAILMFVILLIPTIFNSNQLPIGWSNNEKDTTHADSSSESENNTVDDSETAAKNDNSDVDSGEDTKTNNNTNQPESSKENNSKPTGNNPGTPNNGTGQNSNPNTEKPQQNTDTTLRVGGPYMGGVIPSMDSLYVCYGPTVCAWHLDGAAYAAIYVTPKSGITGPYVWAGRYLDIVGGKLVTAEKDGWSSTNNAGYYSENLRSVFSSDTVEMAKKYNLRVVDKKKLYLSIGGKTYSFSPGYEVIGDYLRCSHDGEQNIKMAPNSQIDVDIKVSSPAFYNPDKFKYQEQIARSDNTKIVEVISIKKKASGIITMTLKSGSYKYGEPNSTYVRYYFGCMEFYVTVKP